MQDILPDSIHHASDLLLWHHCIIVELNVKKKFLKSYVQKQDAEWRRYVNSNLLHKYWNTDFLHDLTGHQVVIPWLSISYESWYKYFALSN